MIDQPIDPDELRSAYAAARELCRRSDDAVTRAAYFAAFFLPREKRGAIYAIAAFGGLMRQALASAGGADGCCSSGSDASGVAEMVRSRIDAAYAGTLQLPLPSHRDATQWAILALSDVLRRYEVPRSYCADWVSGLVADSGVRRYATWNALKQHGDATGGSAAAIAACVLGLTHSDVGDRVRMLGIATRLTTILSNLPADAASGRIYLPLEDLARFRCSERDLNATPSSTTPASAPFRASIEFQVQRARQLFADGSSGVTWLAGDGSRMAAATFVSLQLGVLDAIERAGFDLAGADLRLPLSRQLRQMPAAWRLARRQGNEPMPHASS